jgi:hypothetical protein
VRDHRFLTPNHDQIRALDLDTCQSALLSQLDPRNVECAITGDLSLPEMEQLALKYLGTVPVRAESKLTGATAALSAVSGLGTPHQQRLAEHATLQVHTLGRGEQLNIYLQDSEERAMGYLAGPAPNKYGVYADGTTVADRVVGVGGRKDAGKWKDPLFCHLALQVVQEVSVNVRTVYLSTNSACRC